MKNCRRRLNCEMRTYFCINILIDNLLCYFKIVEFISIASKLTHRLNRAISSSLFLILKTRNNVTTSNVFTKDKIHLYPLCILLSSILVFKSFNCLRSWFYSVEYLSRRGESYCTYRGIDRGVIERATIRLSSRIPHIFIFLI